MCSRSFLLSAAQCQRVISRPAHSFITLRYVSSQTPVNNQLLFDSKPALSSSPSHLSPSTLNTTSSNSPPGKSPQTEKVKELSDQEWEIRTGRAIYILPQTLPTFFTTGLISSLDISGSKSSDDDNISIYSPNIRLEYRPPTPFPAPFPTTLHVEGLPLYLGSAVFIRHTLNALYTDLHVELQRVRVHGPRSSTGYRPDVSYPSSDTPDTDVLPQQKASMRSIREKSLFVGLVVRGTNRVSKAEGGWEVNSTYVFSPVTGLIHLHKIDSIHPAPHQAFFSALQAALSKIGLGDPQGAAGAGGMAPTSSSPVPSRS